MSDYKITEIVIQLITIVNLTYNEEENVFEIY